jgi:CheY-like chemotaxis protein
MNVVIAMIGLLRETDLDPEQAEFVDTISSSGSALLAVVDDILDFSHLESGDLRLDRGDFDLRGEIEDCLDSVAATAAAKGLELVCYIDGDCPQRVVGDKGRLRQVLASLLSNAVAVTAKGEVLVSATIEPVDGGRLLLEVTVTDAGIGICADARDRLFESLTEEDASSTRAYGGTGLGLAISRGLAEAMGGEIRVSSTPGLGSSFTLTVLVDNSAGSMPPAPAAGDPVLVGKSVLLVDDNATSLSMLDLQLTSVGMTCTTVDSAAGALALLAEAPAYDVVILDMLMPSMTGVELGTRLAQDRYAEDVPLVLLTSVGSPPPDTGSFAAYVAKPVKAAALITTLAELLSGRQPASTPITAELPPLAPGVKPLRILLAEDNAVNQRVAELMLTRLGHLVQTVVNGREAVEAVDQGNFDVVLMDVQMPVMDGLEATRRIRSELPGEHHPHIIAMTASVLLEDREAAKAAGMERYLSKPVRAQDLRDLLASISTSKHDVGDKDPDEGAIRQTHLPMLVEETAPVETLDAAHSGTPPIDEAVFDQLIAELGDPEGAFLLEMISSYLQEGTDQAMRLTDAAVGQDHAAFAAVAHAWRSTSALIGATVVASLLSEAEAAARRSSTELPSLARSVVDEYHRVAAWLVARRSQAAVGP